MLKRVAGLALASVGLVAVAASPAGAQQYPPADNSITVSDTTPTPGQTVTVTVRTCLPGAGVTITIDPDVVLGTAPADAEGVLRLDVVIPADTSLGRHTISATCESPTGTLSLSARIVVVPEAAAGAPGGPPAGGAAAPDDAGHVGGSLPRTGDSLSMALLRLALALAALGGVLLALSKRRRATAVAA